MSYQLLTHIPLFCTLKKKDFGAIRWVSDQNNIHLKSFNGQSEVLMEMNTHTDCNI